MTNSKYPSSCGCRCDLHPSRGVKHVSVTIPITTEHLGPFTKSIARSTLTSPSTRFSPKPRFSPARSGVGGSSASAGSRARDFFNLDHAVVGLLQLRRAGGASLNDAAAAVGPGKLPSPETRFFNAGGEGIPASNFGNPLSGWAKSLGNTVPVFYNTSMVDPRPKPLSPASATTEPDFLRHPQQRRDPNSSTRALAHWLVPLRQPALSTRAPSPAESCLVPFAPRYALAHRLERRCSPPPRARSPAGATALLASLLRALAHRRGFQTTRAVLSHHCDLRRWLARNTANSAISCNLTVALTRLVVQCA